MLRPAGFRLHSFTASHQVMQIRTAYKGTMWSNSMLKMSDSLVRLARPHGALLDSEEEDALRQEDGQSEFDPTERILSQKP